MPDPSLSLREGAIAPWSHRHSVHFNEFLQALSAHCGGDIYTPYNQLPERLQKVLLNGSDGEEIPFFFEKDRRHMYRKPFEGLIPHLTRRYRESGSSSAREEMRRYMSTQVCQACHGTDYRGTVLSRMLATRTVAGQTLFSDLTALESRSKPADSKTLI